MSADLGRRTWSAPAAEPIYPEGGLALLRGNIWRPHGAIIKQSAASPRTDGARGACGRVLGGWKIWRTGSTTPIWT